VHIEPHGHEIVVRYRIDGVLRPGSEFKKVPLAVLAQRVKLLGNLDIEEDRVPQEGRFDVAVSKKQYVARVTLLPVADGEKIVLHLSDQTMEPHDLEKLGYWGANLAALRDAAEHTHGLVVVGGPSGAGKSATLYGLLHMVADPSLSIATVEDTIEHRVAGINQTPVNTRAGMTFASALRAVMHQDPNVLMVSDLYEAEATETALQAALAGRLVLAGMNTHDISASLSHMVAMNVEPYLLASGVRAVANQRLVRRLCIECRESYQPSADEIASACTACGMHPEGAVAHITELEPKAAQELGVKIDGTSVKAGKVSRLWRAKPGGCNACGGAGYKGRTVIAEVASMSPALQKLVFAAADGMALYDQAISEGMVPLPLDGLVKASLGVTSLEEVLRVVTA
jgi:type IV pilus assembly protein PilB